MIQPKTRIDIMCSTIAHTLYTFVVFVAFLWTIPFLIFTYLSVQITRAIWFSILRGIYPHLEIVERLTVRSAMDTYHCQGVLTILLQIKGQCNVENVKRKILDDVINKKNADGSLRFPHMKCSLISCWGRYAWIKDTGAFNIRNHVIHVRNPMFRNRRVTSTNIQEFVSEAVTKYRPPWNKIPPWQIMIITTEPNRFYFLARIHHLYLSEDNISFGHLLMIDPEDKWIQTPPQDRDSIENILQQIFRAPRAFPLLYNHILKILTDGWNDFLDEYDPQRNENIDKSSPNIIHLYLAFFIISVFAIQEYTKTNKSLFSIVLHEVRTRRITLSFILRCVANSFYPLVMIRIFVGWIWWFYIKCVVHFPISVLHVVYDTPFYLKWFLMILRAVSEVFYTLHLAFTAPRILLDELILPVFQLPKHHLQKISLSGRKVVCWSDSIPIELVRKIRDKTGVASCEIQLYGLAASLHNYFQKNNLPETDEILTTTRFVPQEHLLKSPNQISSGLLCLSLPMNLPEDDSLYGLHMLQLSLQNAMTNQTALYLGSLWQYDYGFLTTVFPSIMARILLYVLSTRYSVMLTQVEAHTKEMRKRKLIWGQEIESFMYWRPPQANVSLSCTLINYGDEMRFALMADAELAPQYSMIVSQYEHYIRQLAVESENYTENASSRPTSPRSSIS